MHQIAASVFAINEDLGDSREAVEVQESTFQSEKSLHNHVSLSFVTHPRSEY